MAWGDVAKWSKAEVCKTSIRRFESARRLQTKKYRRRKEEASPILTCAESFVLLTQGRGGGMADAADLKSATFTGMWVRIPPSAPELDRS